MSITSQPVPQRAELPRAANVRLLRLPAVMERTGLSRSTIWRLEKAGKFPRRRRVSVNVVAWLEIEIAAWIQRSGMSDDGR